MHFVTSVRCAVLCMCVCACACGVCVHTRMFMWLETSFPLPASVLPPQVFTWHQAEQLPVLQARWPAAASAKTQFSPLLLLPARHPDAACSQGREEVAMVEVGVLCPLAVQLRPVPIGPHTTNRQGPTATMAYISSSAQEVFIPPSSLSWLYLLNILYVCACVCSCVYMYACVAPTFPLSGT